MKKCGIFLGKNKILIDIYHSIENQIDLRLSEFRYIWQNGTEYDIFTELCFCICTPQSNARLTHKVITYLKDKNILLNGNVDEIRTHMNGVRFPNNKSQYLFNAKNLFLCNKKIKIKNKIDVNNVYDTRLWLINNVKGLGPKEASHFLRNIGFGNFVVILDRHVLRNLIELKIIDEMPTNLSIKKYIEIEQELIKFSKFINISLESLDFVFWFKETGCIFK